jgi:hypothetical protein
MNANPQDPPEPAPPATLRDNRRELLTRLREVRGSDLVLTYITSTRPALEAAMALDAVRCFHDHLPAERVDQLDLVVHSNGGDGVVPWRLMTLLHEYAKKVDVLVPHRAFSAATLAALGAHEITMHPMGMLGPIDASVNNPLGPINRSASPCQSAERTWPRFMRSSAATSESSKRSNSSKPFRYSPRKSIPSFWGTSSAGALSLGCWARS